MERDSLIVNVIGILYPFILLLGIYVILQGHNSPGGGFQGGAVLSAIFISKFFVIEENLQQDYLAFVEKVFIVSILLMVCASFFTTGEFFTNPFSEQYSYEVRRIYLVIMNFFIAMKVACGLTIIFYQFIEKGRGVK